MQLHVDTVMISVFHSGVHWYTEMYGGNQRYTVPFTVVYNMIQYDTAISRVLYIEVQLNTVA